MPYDADVLIIGAGPAGLGAAVISSRCGMKTMVAEAYGVPGGMAVIAEVQPFMLSFYNGEDLDRPVYQEWMNAMRKYQNADALELIQRDKGYAKRNINKEIAALSAEDMLLKENVQMLYHHRLTGVKMLNGNIESVELHSKSGFKNFRARIYIDCTGDGDLAALANCRYDMGNENGNCQPMTLCFKLGNVHVPYVDHPGGALNLIDPQWRKELNQRYLQAVKDGKLHCDREDVLLFPFRVQSGDIIHFNTTRVVKHSGIDGKELSDAEIEARRQMREIFFWLRDEIAGFEKAEILSMGIQIGVRESRRIKGLMTLTKDHFEAAAKFPDAIARSNYHIDIHSPDGSGTYRQSMPPGEYYEIPYRCIVPEDCGNLLIGGRPISADMAMHSSLRVMPTAISIGQAAGCAAAMAVNENTAPRNLDGTKIRQKLKKLGAFLTLALAVFAGNLNAQTPDTVLSKHSGRMFFTRHAQRATVQAPSYDPPLTPLGRKQTELLAAELKKRNFQGIIYASPYRRTLETAAIIAEATNSKIVPLAGLQEYVSHAGYPRVQVRTFKELQKEFPLLTGSTLPDQWALKGPETLLDVKKRVEKLLQALPAKPEKVDWLFVTHGAVVKGAYLLSIDYNSGKLPSMPMNWNCCLSEYNFTPNGKLQLVTLFDVSFLPKDMITSNEKKFSGN